MAGYGLGWGAQGQARCCWGHPCIQVLLLGQGGGYDPFCHCVPAGYQPYAVTHASDYFDQLYTWALELIRR